MEEHQNRITQLLQAEESHSEVESKSMVKPIRLKIDWQNDTTADSISISINILKQNNSESNETLQ